MLGSVLASPEVVELAVRRGTLSEVPEMGKGLGDGVRDAFRKLVAGAPVLGHSAPTSASSPGLGASIVDWVAYGHAVQSNKDPEAEFGKGEIRGVIAPESANKPP